MEDNHVIKQLVCKVCGYKWFPRAPSLPKVCPSCKHRNWNEEVPNVKKKGRSKTHKIKTK
jgi:rubrerythrin